MPVPPSRFWCGAAFAMLLSFASAAATDPSRPGVTHAAFATPTTVITSPQQLDAYLRHTLPSASPLHLLTPGARQRFLASLRFGEHGLGGFATGDLAYDLTAREVADVLGLFGAQQYALVVDARSTPRPASLDGGPSSLAPLYARLVVAAESGVDRAKQARVVAALYTSQMAPCKRRLGCVRLVTATRNFFCGRPRWCSNSRPIPHC